MTLRRFIKRLRIKRGDIILVDRNESCGHTTDGLIAAGRTAGLDYSVPIVYVEGKHGVERLSFDKLERLYLEAKNARTETKG